MQRREIEGEEGLEKVFLPAILELACYSGYDHIITEFLPQDLTTSVDEILVAVCTLEHIVKNGKTQHYGTAVELLEAIHSKFPELGNTLLYVKLLVDLKTKAAISEMFMAGSVSNGERRAILDKYFDPDVCQLYSEQSDIPQPDLCTTIEEYSASLHAFARTGLINLMESKRQCLAFQRNHLLNPTAAIHLHENLVGELQEYLRDVRLQLPLPSVLQWYMCCNRRASVTMATHPVTESLDVLSTGSSSDIGSPNDIQQPTAPKASLKLHDFSIDLYKLPIRNVPSRFHLVEPVSGPSQSNNLDHTSSQELLSAPFSQGSALDRSFLQECLSDDDLSDQHLLQMASKIVRRISWSKDDAPQDKSEVGRLSSDDDTMTDSLLPPTKKRRYTVSTEISDEAPEEGMQEPEIDVEVVENTPEQSTSIVQTTEDERQQPTAGGQPAVGGSALLLSEETNPATEQQRKLRSHRPRPQKYSEGPSSPITTIATEDTSKANKRVNLRKRKVVSYDESVTPLTAMVISESPVHRKRTELKLRTIAKRKVTFANCNTKTSTNVEGQIFPRPTTSNFLNAIETPTSKRRHISEEKEVEDQADVLVADVEHLQIAHSEGSVDFEDGTTADLSDGGSVEYPIQDNHVITQNKGVHIVHINPNTEGSSRSKPARSRKWAPKVAPPLAVVEAPEKTKEPVQSTSRSTCRWSKYKYARNVTPGSVPRTSCVNVEPTVITLPGKGTQSRPRRGTKKKSAKPSNAPSTPSPKQPSTSSPTQKSTTHPANAPSTSSPKPPSTWSRKQKATNSNLTQSTRKHIPAVLRRLLPKNTSPIRTDGPSSECESDVLDLIDAEEEATQPQSQYDYNAIQRVAHTSNRSRAAHSDGTSEHSASESIVSESTTSYSSPKKPVLERIYDIPPH